jgi:hypothetical protein
MVYAKVYKLAKRRAFRNGRDSSFSASDGANNGISFRILLLLLQYWEAEDVDAVADCALAIGIKEMVDNMNQYWVNTGVTAALFMTIAIPSLQQMPKGSCEPDLDPQCDALPEEYNDIADLAYIVLIVIACCACTFSVLTALTLCALLNNVCCTLTHQLTFLLTYDTMTPLWSLALGTVSLCLGLGCSTYLSFGIFHGHIACGLIVGTGISQI